MSVSWSELYAGRKDVNRRYPSLFRLPTVRRAIRLAEPLVVDGARILEVGGGPNPRAPRLAERVRDATVVTVDPDPAAAADHAAVGDAGGPFDLALCLETIEHLTLADGRALLEEIRARLAPGGKLLVSTPNVFCPGRFLRDATHVTPYAWDELGGLLQLCGYGLDGLWRVVPGHFFRRLGKGVTAPLGRALGVDHAPSIAALAHTLLG
jgi:SAM-dependent methyltransferase